MELEIKYFLLFKDRKWKLMLIQDRIRWTFPMSLGTRHMRSTLWLQELMNNKKLTGFQIYKMVHSWCLKKYIDLSSQHSWLYTTCQKRISCTVLVFGSPSGHNGITTYTANLSLALILLTIFNANSIGIRLSAPAHHNNRNNLRTNVCMCVFYLCCRV
jgi:hypothetical protein